MTGGHKSDTILKVKMTKSQNTLVPKKGRHQMNKRESVPKNGRHQMNKRKSAPKKDGIKRERKKKYAKIW